MVDSTGSGEIVGQRTAGATKLVVEADAYRRTQQALGDALAVAFGGRQILAGPRACLGTLPDIEARCARCPTSFLPRGRTMAAPN
jgi:hypothetical protein